MAGASALGDVASVFVNGVVYTFLYGVMAAAYVQVAGDDGGRGGAETSTTPSTRSSPEL